MKLTPVQFKNASTHLMNQVWNAQHAYAYFWAINQEHANNPILVHSKGELWHETRQAFFTATVFELCRLYDKTSGSFSVREWLQSGMDTFNPQIDAAEWKADIGSVSKTDPLVKTLIDRRNKGLFHVDFKQIRDKQDFSKLYPMTIADTKELIERAYLLLDKYHSVFVAGSTGVARAAPAAGYVSEVFRELKFYWDDPDNKKQRERMEKMLAAGRRDRAQQK